MPLRKEDGLLVEFDSHDSRGERKCFFHNNNLYSRLIAQHSCEVIGLLQEGLSARFEFLLPACVDDSYYICIYISPTDYLKASEIFSTLRNCMSECDEIIQLIRHIETYR